MAEPVKKPIQGQLQISPSSAIKGASKEAPLPHGSAPQPAAMKAAAPRATGSKGGADQPAAGEPAAGGLELLIAIEDRARAVSSRKELEFFAVNETRKLTGARQIFFLAGSGSDNFRVEAVSSIGAVERDTPLIRWIERIVANLANDIGLDKPVEFSLPAYCDPTSEDVRTYPFPSFHWQPLSLRDGTAFAGLLQTREAAWRQADIRVSQRLGTTYAHAMAALSGDRSLRPGRTLKRRLLLASAVLAGLAAFIPVPMTALAPVEVVARAPFIVTAPVDGVVREALVQPNRMVKTGERLVAFDDVALRNRYELAEREAKVAEASYRRAVQAAFSDAEARHQLAIARSELELKAAERDYAAELLAKTELTAPQGGLLIYSDKEDWEGRPVKTGEQIMKIADPSQVAFRIELPIADAIVLEDNARVKIFLDADPLHALEARLTRASYEAAPSRADQLSFDLRAELDSADQALPRIGARGTAQVFGDRVPLFFFLFRRPISSARQFLGF